MDAIFSNKKLGHLLAELVLTFVLKINIHVGFAWVIILLLKSNNPSQEIDIHLQAGSKRLNTYLGRKRSVGMHLEHFKNKNQSTEKDSMGAFSAIFTS